MSDIERAKALLSEGGYTCVICGGDDIRTFDLRGVKPLVSLVNSGEDLQGYSAADKVVGRATAFLYVLLGVSSVYAKVISKTALDALNKTDISVSYGKLTERIINRSGDGICPFEKAVLGIDDPHEAYTAILKKMREMNISI